MKPLLRRAEDQARPGGVARAASAGSAPATALRPRTRLHCTARFPRFVHFLVTRPRAS